MTDPTALPITADTLQRRAEWQATFPGSTLVSETTADEGVGIGFDGIDPSAMMRALYRTASPWPDVLAWYRDLLEVRGWQGRRVLPHEWWTWVTPMLPGERIDVLYRGQTAPFDGWPIPEHLVGMTEFEVLFRASSLPGVVPGESSTFPDA